MKKEIVQGKERILRTKQRKDTTNGRASLVAVWGNGGNGGTGRESERTSLTNFICVMWEIFRGSVWPSCREKEEVL